MALTGYLWTAVALTATVASGALVLALLLARRLRLLQERIEPFAGLSGLDLPEPGIPVPEFVATTISGDQVSTEDLAGPDVPLLFLTASCSPCQDVVAGLRQALAGTARSPLPIAVVIGEPRERAPLVMELEQLARVVEQDYTDGLAGRFQVRGFPAVLVAGGGSIRQAAHSLDEVRIGLPT
jgi:hypothetical protein